ncbi:HD domain-containing phosphohydrolase [Vibrio jasicida]|uniref:HD domain-containing phosphohydrolase n=1 Tax=Vibrio jasicida TaxID=766224 RepID=UPI0015E28B34|nr:HD domain-containing phosphohydrolase [Vibrio jasicida]
MKRSSELKSKYSIKFIVSSMFMLVTALTAIFAMGMQYYFGQKMSQEHVISRLSTAAADVSEYIHQVDSNAISSTRMLKSFLSMSDHNFSEKEILTLFAQVLDENPFIQSLYVGSENEDFFQIINLKTSVTIRDKMSADAVDRWAIAKATGIGPDRQMIVSYVDSNFNVNRTVASKTSFYPTRRPWFIGATETNVYKTEPYLFKNMKVTGQSYAIRSGKDVIGIDIELSTLNSKIASTALGMSLESGAESFIFNHKGEVIASNIDLERDIEVPPSEPLTLTEPQRALVMNSPALLVSNQNDWGPYDFSQAGEPQGYAVDLLRILSQQTGLEFDFINGFESITLSKKYLKGTIDVLHSVSGEVPEYGEQSATMYTAGLAIAGKSQRFIPISLENFTDEVGVVCGFGMKEWLQENYPKLNIVEFESLSDAKEALEKGEIPYLVDTYLTLDELNGLEKTSTVTVRKLDAKPVPYHIYINKKHAGLLEVLNLAIESITPEQREALTQKWLESNHWRGTFVPYPEVFQLSKDTSNYNTMVRRSIEGQNYFVYVTPISSSSGGDDYFSVVIPKEIVTDAVTKRLFNSLLFTALVMLGLFPLAWRLGTPMTRSIYALKARTRKIRARRFDRVWPMTTRVKEIDELSDAMMEMVAEIQSHEKQQEEFVEAFIRLIAQAIDDKSPYTAGHCNRVPEIGMMLAEAAEKCQSGKFKNFAFQNDAERREFRIAAWLHDCGKITTPEHIVDKGTKLEANYNRINEIRTRFEVLRRDLEIEYLNALLRGEVDKDVAKAEFEEKVRQLNDDFEFIANANIGGEFMSEDKIERVKQIAEKTWLRYFDDRLGLSPFEEMNKPTSDTQLPVREKLLEDKPEHIIKRIRPVEFAPEHGIQMQVPEHQYNMGEVYNLTISRGTLTPEDRFKINEHMISGIKMLEALPFPPELSNVPRYASTHHETLKGTGYPRKLSADDLSIPERILVIADIFEALTAGDRPYKKAKPVSVAIDIMYKMALDEHLDMDLFLLFLESGVYLEYAKKFMPETQVDEVDIQKYLSH